MAQNTEDDLFEEAKQNKQSIKAKDVAKLNEKIPASKVLYQENDALNMILAEKSRKVEVIELDEEEEDDVTDEKVIAQLKTLGINTNVKVKIETNIKLVQTKSMDDSNIEELKDDEISNYIGAEEDEENDKLFN